MRKGNGTIQKGKSKFRKKLVKELPPSQSAYSAQIFQPRSLMLESEYHSRRSPGFMCTPFGPRPPTLLVYSLPPMLTQSWVGSRSNSAVNM